MVSNRKVELCLASAHFFPTHGGAQLRFLRYLPGLYQRGVHTHVVAGSAKAKKQIALEGVSRMDRGGMPVEDLSDDIPVHRVRLPGRAGWPRSIIFNQAILRFCRQPGYRPDVLQVVSSLQPRSIPWITRLRKLGVSVVYAYTIPVILPPFPIKRAFRRWSWGRLYRHLDSVIVGSAAMEDHLLDLGVKTRIETIPNGVNLQRFRPARDDAERKHLRASFGMSDRSRMITFVGAVHPRKGCDLLLEAWVRLAQRFPDAHLFLVGLRKDQTYSKLADFRRKLETLIAESGASDRVHFSGLVRNVEGYLRASDVFVFPSLREGMPNVVLEAMASGLPVVLTPFLGLSRDFGKPEEEYLLVERDPDDLASGIARVLESNGLRAALGQRGRSWVEKTMDIERSLDRYAALYHELADRSRLRKGS